MVRFGGGTKKAAPVIQYVDKVVERIVEKEVVVEKPVEVVVPVPETVTKTIFDMINQVYFGFNSSEFTEADRPLLDDIATMLKSDTSRKYLITGQTDARGGDAYNEALSDRRAKTVVREMLKRGVPAEMMKSRGVGKRIAAAAATATDKVREGDRKMTIEIVTNMDYWDYLK